MVWSDQLSSTGRSICIRTHAHPLAARDTRMFSTDCGVREEHPSHVLWRKAYPLSTDDGDQLSKTPAWEGW